MGDTLSLLSKSHNMRTCLSLASQECIPVSLEIPLRDRESGNLACHNRESHPQSPVKRGVPKPVASLEGNPSHII